MKEEGVIKAFNLHLSQTNYINKDRTSWQLYNDIGITIFPKDTKKEEIYATIGYHYEIYIKNGILTIYDLNADCYYAKERIKIEDIDKIHFYKEVTVTLGCYE